MEMDYAGTAAPGNTEAMETAAPDRRRPAAPFLRAVETHAIRHFSHFASLPPVLLALAPSGYGKTLFISAVARSLGRQGCGTRVFSPDAGAPASEPMLRRVERALGCEACAGAGAARDASMAGWSARIDAVLWALEAIEDEIVLFFDGFEPARDRTLDPLIERVAAGDLARVRMVFACTELPVDLVHKVRLLGGIHEIGPIELSLGHEEIRALFSSAPTNPVVLGSEQLAAVADLTEGWPAAVRLVHVAMSACGASDATRRREGHELSLTDTLSRQVLAAQEPAAVHFLLEIAELECFNAELCVYMMGDTRVGETLAALVRNNTMIVAAAGRPGWYRLHHLFRDYLRRERRSSRSETERKALLSRALRWHHRHGYHHDALELALAIREGRQAGGLLAVCAQLLVRDQGQPHSYIAAYERLLALDASPASEAAYWYVWAMVFARQYEKAYRALASIPPGDFGQDTGGGVETADERMLSRKEALLSVILFSLDRVPEARLRGEHWLSADDGLDPFETAGVCCVVGTAGIADLDFQTARHGIQRARISMNRTDSAYGMAWISCLEALIDLEEGDAPLDPAVLAEAMERAGRALGPHSPIVSTMDAMMARIVLDRGETDLARTCVLRSLGQARQHGFIETVRVALGVAIRLWDGSPDSVFAPSRLEDIVTSFPARLQVIHDCAVLVRLVRLGLDQAAADWVRRQNLEPLLAAGRLEYPAGRLGSVQRALLAGRIAWRMSRRDFDAAHALVETGLRIALKSVCAPWTVHLLLVRAQILLATGQSTQAGKAFLRAVGLAAPRHLLQPFIEYGDVVRTLLAVDEKKQRALVVEQERDFLDTLRRWLDLSNDAADIVEAAGRADQEIGTEAPTGREIELLGYVDLGLSNQGIADRLGLSVGTVKWHLHNLYGKLQVRNRSGAIFKARQTGLLRR
jgi:LuxR family maltose regulon positive regulatory protein